MLEDNSSKGVWSNDADVQLTDVVIRDTESIAGSDAGEAALVYIDGDVRCERCVFERNPGEGIFAWGGTLELTDFVLRDTVETPASMIGRGLGIYEGVVGSLERARIERTSEVAILVMGAGADFSLTDVHVTSVLGRGRDGLGGRGIAVQDGGVVTGSRVLVEQSREIGISAADEGASASFTDLLVRDTLPRSCAADTCASAPAGYGLMAYLGGSVRAGRFAVERSALCGLLIARDGEIDLMTGEVSGSPVGACLQVPGFDVTRLSDGVLFRDNERTFESTEHSVPDAVAPSML